MPVPGWPAAHGSTATRIDEAWEPGFRPRRRVRSGGPPLELQRRQVADRSQVAAVLVDHPGRPFLSAELAAGGRPATEQPEAPTIWPPWPHRIVVSIEGSAISSSSPSTGASTSSAATTSIGTARSWLSGTTVWWQRTVGLLRMRVTG